MLTMETTPIANRMAAVVGCFASIAKSVPPKPTKIPTTPTVIDTVSKKLSRFGSTRSTLEGLTQARASVGEQASSWGLARLWEGP